MKKHPEKYWFGSMVLLLAILLVALFDKVDIPNRASVVVSKEKVEYSLVESSSVKFTE